MEQIIITRKDGTTYPLAVKKEATEIKQAQQSWGLLGDDVVNITVESPYQQHYELGDYFSVFGRTYKLNQPARVRKSGTHKYTYELTFEGVQYDLLRAFYDVTIETTGNTLQDVQGDALTGNLHRFAMVLVSNANRVFPGKWKLGACPDTIADKTLTFGDGDNCLAVYQNLCQTFEVEASITQQDGVYTIHFHKSVGIIHPFVFEFGKGKGLYDLDRQNVDSSNIVTRLKVFGSEDNITNKYRANRLCLPGKSKAQSFIEQAEAVQKYGIHEARKIFEDIKPTFDGVVTEIVSGNVLQFKDANMFDLNAKEADGKTTKYLVAGVNAKIHFNTGNLAGYEFEINASKGGYNHNTKTFTLIPIKEAGGYTFPDEKHKAFQIKVGDKYKILDVTLPKRYQQEAERKLQEQANKYYEQNSQPKVKYGLRVAKSYLKKMFGEEAQMTLFSPGDYVKVKDESIGVDKAVRIQSLTRNLLDVCDYTLTLSDVAEHNITTRIISELVEIDKITTTHQLKDPARAKANWRSSREVLNMVFDPDGDYYTDKIKPNSIDTLALSVGAKSMQFALQNVVFEPNYQGQKNLVRASAGTLTHYTIEEQPRIWAMAQAIVELNEDASAYYIFAKCNKANNSASIVFRKIPIKVEEDPNYYHFWIGVVNSVDATLQARSIALSYGFSMINGRFIKTGRVESADASTYFDLDDGEVGGNINFKDGVVSGDIGVGNEDGINAGLSGQGNAATDVRFYAGATKSQKEQAPFRVLHDGTAYMTKANVSGKINATSGKIGRFDINTDSIGAANDFDTSTGMSLTNTNIRFRKTDSYDSSISFASIGNLNWLGEEKAGLFCITAKSFSKSGISLYTEFSAPEDNRYDYFTIQRAFEYNGNFYGMGKVATFDTGYIGAVYTNVIVDYLTTAHKFHFTTCDGRYVTINLPTKDTINKKVGEKDIIFNIEIVCDRNMPNRIKVKSSDGAQIYNNDGNAIDGLDMMKGDAICLRYYNGGYHVLFKQYTT